jgi:hypothetical protein
MRAKPADGVTPRAPTALVFLAPGALLLCAPAAHAQTRWTVDPQASLAWWQVVPNLRQYWATTCPADPDWQHPHVSGSDSLLGTVNHPVPLVPDTAGAQNEDTVYMPLYARRKVRWDCADAVRGVITVTDKVHWQGVHGVVAVRADSLLVTGEKLRGPGMYLYLETCQFPEILFTVDSLVGVTEQADTTRGTAVGMLTVRDRSVPTTAAVTILPDTVGVRVLAKWHIPAQGLLTLVPWLRRIPDPVPSLWKFFFMGADLVFRRESPNPERPSEPSGSVTAPGAAPRANPVPATAPDSVPRGYYDASNLVRNTARLSVSFYRDIVAVLFKPTATIAQRQAVVDSVSGTVIGGLPLCGAGDGFYLVRLPHDSTNNRPLDAAAKLMGLPGVGAAAPDFVFSVEPHRVRPYHPPSQPTKGDSAGARDGLPSRSPRSR